MLLQMHGRPLDANSLAALVAGPGPAGPRPGRLPDRRQQLPRRRAGPGPRPSRTRTPSCAAGPARRSSAATCRRRCRSLWPLLGDPDPFVRTAARLCLQRLPVKDWAKHLWTEENDLIFMEGVVALCKTDQAAPFEEQIFDHLHKGVPEDAEAQLQYLRTVQLALLHTPADERPGSVRRHRPGVRGALPDQGLARQPRTGPGADVPPARQHAGAGRRRHAQNHPGAARRQGRGRATASSRSIISTALRFLTDGWTPAQKKAVADWYEGTRDWKGGNSFSGFLLNIFKEVSARTTSPPRWTC